MREKTATMEWREIENETDRRRGKRKKVNIGLYDKKRLDHNRR